MNIKAEIIEDAQVLTPNAEHKNFTRTTEIIPKGAIVNGHIMVVAGRKKGEPFEYKLFTTDKNQIIYLKKIKPMNTTEINLGADGEASSTKVSLPNVSNLGKKPIIGAVLGGSLAFYICHKKHIGGHQKVLYTIVGGLLGFAAGKYCQARSAVKVTPSK